MITAEKNHGELTLRTGISVAEKEMREMKLAMTRRKWFHGVLVFPSTCPQLRRKDVQEGIHELSKAIHSKNLIDSMSRIILLKEN